MMNIVISNRSGQPIYEQIMSQIKALIMTNVLKEGDLLPSMRLLAKELRISVITTKRAYEEMERDGFIVSVHGKGSFVAGKNLNFVREEHLKFIEEQLQKVIETASYLNLDLAELIEMLRLLYKGE